MCYTDRDKVLNKVISLIFHIRIGECIQTYAYSNKVISRFDTIQLFVIIFNRFTSIILLNILMTAAVN